MTYLFYCTVRCYTKIHFYAKFKKFYGSVIYVFLTLKWPCAGGVEGAEWGQRPTISLTEHMTGGARSCLFAALFFPDSNRHPSIAAISKERHFQSPVGRSRIRTRNLMYYNRASLITWKAGPRSAIGRAPDS